MKKTLIIFIVLAVLAGGGYYAYTLGYFDQWLPKQHQTDAEGNRIFSDEEIAKYEQYMKEAHDFVVQAETGNTDLYKQAVEAFKKASSVGDDKFWNPLLGIAEAYRKLSQYDKAEDAYNKALEVSKYGEAKIYQAKIDMYRYDLKKSNEDIKKIYEEGIAKVLDNENLILSYGSFLKSIGDYYGALKAYEAILLKFPDNELYKKEVENLKKKIAN